MSHPTGRKLAISPARRFVWDLMYFSRSVPFASAERTMQLDRVARAREAAVPRPGWCALFTRAFALVAREMPVLRRAFLRWPWPHFYEHPESIASIAVDRRVGDDDTVLFTRLRGPDNQQLSAISQRLRHAKEAPIEEVASFRRILELSRWPLPVRRLLWAHAFYSSGRRRARMVGTYSVSTVAGLGAGIQVQTGPLTSVLTYSPQRPDGSLDVRLTFDHRVYDGAAAARALAGVEAALSGALLGELHGLCGQSPAA